MSFWIQVCNPISLQVTGETANDLSEAIEMVFPMETEDALIVWNHEYIPLSYKYDLSVIIDDLLPMCDDLLSHTQGAHQVCFGSDTFTTEWNLSWSDGILSVSAQWNSVVGDLEAVISNCNQLEMRVDDFLSEWKGIFVRIENAIEHSGLVLADIENYQLMKEIEGTIKKVGYLYRDRRSV